MTIHGACIGPIHATNVHRDCPGVFTTVAGEVRVCGCTVCNHQETK